jgi:putative ABC transport system permease protein
MVKNYFTVAWRNLIGNHVFSLINVAGLSIGLVVGFLIYLYVQFENSYDHFHQHAHRLYRVPIEYSGSFASFGTTATNHPALGPALKQDFPQVQAFARLVRTSLFMNALSLSSHDLTGEPRTFNESKMYLADSSFLTMFSFPIKEGEAENALAVPNAIALSETTAKKYFGNQSALGKHLQLNGQMNLTVTAVFHDLPANSHLQFDVLLSFATLGPKWGNDNWTWPEFYTYLLLAPDADPRQLEAKFPAFAQKYLGKIMQEYHFQSRFFLQPVTDIHLKSSLGFEQHVNGSERTVYFLSLLALFVLLIAGINYVNLSTARSLKRSREVGLRKVVGASKTQLLTQFFFDALLVNLLALLFSLLMLWILLPFFEQLVGKPITEVLYRGGLWRYSSFWALVGASLLLGTLVVGLYPAILLASFNPVLVLKGNFNRSQSGILLRKCLVGFQYVLSIFLIGGTLIIYGQLSYMREQDLGYAKDQVLIVPSPAVYDSTLTSRMEYFKNQLAGLPDVGQMTASDDIPGRMLTQRNTIRKAEQTPQDNFNTYLLAVDHSFLPTYAISLAAGRNFRLEERFIFLQENQADNLAPPSKVLINEEVCKRLGFARPEEAINQPITFRIGREYTGQVIGVVKNYHQVSFKEQYAPILYFYPPDGNWKYFSLSVKTKDLKATLERIEESYKKAFPNNAFEYFFLDEYFDQQYQGDRQFGTIFGIFTLLAILIACLGLVGLSVFAVTQRTREVGIRKVLGASVSNILLLFSKESLWLLIISYGLAVPLLYWAGSSWLDNFAFRIALGWQVFTLPLVFLLMISVSTICFIAWKAAVSNPTHSLRQK